MRLASRQGCEGSDDEARADERTEMLSFVAENPALSGTHEHKLVPASLRALATGTLTRSHARTQGLTEAVATQILTTLGMLLTIYAFMTTFGQKVIIFGIHNTYNL
eukprot:6212759-Pleurochrysis_carterae.AAC.5